MKQKLFILFGISLFMSLTCFAQNTGKTKIEQTGKTTNNVSAWKSNVQTQKSIPANNINSNPNIQKTSSTIKEVKVANPEGYYHPETGKIKLANSSESTEVKKREMLNHEHF